MQVESLISLVRGGNLTTVEKEWAKLFDAPAGEVDHLCTYSAVLKELKEGQRQSHAETLAWSAIGFVSSRMEPVQAVRVAGALLLALGDNAEVRGQVADLYRKAYGHETGFDSLMQIAGVAAGRPVRRALRTMDVCLTAQAGGYVISRDEGTAGRVEDVDRTEWSFSVSLNGLVESLGALHFADNYEPVASSDFRVLKQFEPDSLGKRLQDDPAPLLAELCKRHGGKVDGALLESLLVPDLITAGQWKAWWLNARTSLKKSRSFKVEGRTPYTLVYVPTRDSAEDELLAAFDAIRDPSQQLALVEAYIRDCKQRNAEPAAAALTQCYEALRDQAEQRVAEKSPLTAATWLAARQIGEIAGVADPGEGVREFLASLENPTSLMTSLADESLITAACDMLVEIRPTETAWLLDIFPKLPTAACEHAGIHLLKSGCPKATFAPVVQQILAKPVEHHGALIWLWSGAKSQDLAEVAPITVLSKMFKAVDECRRNEKLSKDRARTIVSDLRSALASRRFDRFVACLAGLDRGMGVALRTQVSRLDNLGKSGQHDLMKILNQHFPPDEPKQKARPWERQDIIFCTNGGILHKQAEIDQHVNVKMRENSKAIGEAAAKGDLSENSEYKFALEERDLLQARLIQMNAEMDKARPLSPNDVPTEHAGIGTRITLRHTADGRTFEEICFLGPWDVDPERNVVNYLAPLASRFLGKKVGDKVDVEYKDEVGQYEITGLRNELEGHRKATPK